MKKNEDKAIKTMKKVFTITVNYFKKN